jgi:hypothetical protein
MGLFVKKKLESGFTIEDQYPASNVSTESDATNRSNEDPVSAQSDATNRSNEGYVSAE